MVGWGRVVGCIASSISVHAYRTGHVTRTVQPGAPGYTVFRVGEVHGRITPRVEEVTGLLTAIIESAEAGIPTPTHRALVAVVKQVERKELEPAPGLVQHVWDLTGLRPLAVAQQAR